MDRSAFTVGTDLGVTPGAVIHREEVLELIEYTPSTPTVRHRPLLIVPPPIGRFYFLDLRPGRSFVEYAVARGFQVFMISWRNPTKEQADWDLDTYAKGIDEAIDVVQDVTGSADVNTLGFCAGGILMTTVLNHLAANGDDRVHSAGYAVTLLDFHSRAPIGAFSSPRLLQLARRNSAAAGSSPPGRWAPSSLGCAPTTWCSTTSSPSGCWARTPGVRHPRLERRRDEPARPAARAVPGDLRRQLARAGRADTVLGTPVRPGPDHACPHS